MRRLNVRETQIDECIEKSMFAFSIRPQSPELQPGELLLLQLVKDEARLKGKLHARIDFALVFDHLERDYDGVISRLHWPHAGRIWPWIVYCSATVPSIPFSLEDLPLTQGYDGQTNPRYIEPRDEAFITPFIQWALAEIPEPARQLVPASQVAQKFGKEPVLAAIYNHDRIATVHTIRETRATLEGFKRNQSLSESLKSYYSSRCQVCGQDFEPRYGIQLADTHHIHYLQDGGLDVSDNLVVVCPNHHRVIHASNARFDRHSLAYEYPNGLQEQLILPDHFKRKPVFLT